MAWLQANLITGKESASRVEGLFERLGAISVTLTDAEDEPLLEPPPGESPLWRRTKVSALFDGQSDAEALRREIDREMMPGEGTLELERIEDQAWERAWMDDFHPMSFGRRLWICPQGERPPDPDAVIVELDPGLAFGTGTHPTTSLCLQWLDANPPTGLEVLDFGCGSGILAIAAIRMGAHHALATDHDPQALEATAANAAKNRVQERIAIHGGKTLPGEPVDLVLANILAGTLIDLEAQLAGLCRPGGRIVLSGILPEQAGRVSDAYSTHFEMRPAVTRGGWCLLEGRRR